MTFKTVALNDVIYDGPNFLMRHRREMREKREEVRRLVKLYDKNVEKGRQGRLLGNALNLKR